MFDLDDMFPKNNELLSSSDEADIECNDCIGCDTCCCREISATVILDSWDIALLKKGTGKTFDEMVEEGLLRIIEFDGLKLPAFGMKKEKYECCFLNDAGRCTVHPYRSGICRLYPLARLWKEDGSFAYYLQKGECVHRTTAKTKVSDWLGYDDIESYEKAVREYHDRLKAAKRAVYSTNSEEQRRNIADRFIDDNFR